MIPKQTIILLSGTPATGKTSFGKYLARERDFAHYDLEKENGWPRPQLKREWQTSRSGFVKALREQHARVVLDWGFPPECYQWVKELRGCGVMLVWFEGDIEAARRAFKGPPEAFEVQCCKINRANYPAELNCLVIPALSENGRFLDQREIESRVYGEVGDLFQNR
jgi:hypothetical protein